MIVVRENINLYPIGMVGTRRKHTSLYHSQRMLLQFHDVIWAVTTRLRMYEAGLFPFLKKNITEGHPSVGTRKL